MGSPLAHGMFALERRYDAAPDRVFRAFSDPLAFRRWFAEAPGAEISEWTHDFRIGGRGGGRYRFGGPEQPMRFNATRFQDIVENRRIVWSYVMGREQHGDRLRDSASLATVELFGDGGGARLIYTEQGAYFGPDGGAHIPLREAGCAQMLANLAQDLETHP